MNSWATFFRLIRPKQWVKNGVVFLPLLFAGEFLKLSSCLLSIAAFCCFSLVASTVYVLNDILDYEADKRHPIKSLQRPIAAGDISLAHAKLIFAVLLFG